MLIIHHKKTIAMAALAALGMAALTVQAGANPLPSRTVGFSDLKPQQAEGAKMLYGRIRNAGDEV